jgi:hypothetical protein
MRTSTVAIPIQKTPEEQRGAFEERSNRIYAEALQQETNQLLAAGFSMNRIQWLRMRAEELETNRKRSDTERLKSGLPVELDLAHRLDRDLDLVDEIGADEYEKYRAALGRANTIKVTSVDRGGIAESAGMKTGDEIIKYGGQRVYNMGQVTAIAEKGRPGEMVAIEVLREGRPLQLSALKGELGIIFPVPMPEKSKLLRMGMLASPHLN